jgi:hypothetical protein
VEETPTVLTVKLPENSEHDGGQITRWFVFDGEFAECVSGM